MNVRPAKTQISLGIRPVWSESSLSAWRKLGSLATHWAHSEDSDQTGRMPRLTWVFAGRTLTLLVLSCRGSSSVTIPHPSLHTAVSQHLYISTTGFVRTIVFPPLAFETTAIRKFIYFIYLFIVYRQNIKQCILQVNNLLSSWIDWKTTTTTTTTTKKKKTLYRPWIWAYSPGSLPLFSKPLWAAAVKQFKVQVGIVSERKKTKKRS